MYRHHHWSADDLSDRTSERQTASLAAIVVILLLLVGGLFLVHHLHTAARIEDCLLSGRHNCEVIVNGWR